MVLVTVVVGCANIAASSVSNLLPRAGCTVASVVLFHRRVMGDRFNLPCLKGDFSRVVFSLVFRAD